jgi:hypothetical protein
MSGAFEIPSRPILGPKLPFRGAPARALYMQLRRRTPAEDAAPCELEIEALVV